MPSQRKADKGRPRAPRSPGELTRKDFARIQASSQAMKKGFEDIKAGRTSRHKKRK